MKAGDKVQIKYKNKKPQKQVLTLLTRNYFNGHFYWFVKERLLAIPENILILWK